jgi:hypothetical protein
LAFRFRKYLPKPGIDPKKWAVIACDQFTSEPEYWHDVEKIVGDAPSTLNLTFPEVHLEKPGETERIQSIQLAMRSTWMKASCNRMRDLCTWSAPLMENPQRRDALPRPRTL